MKEHRKIPVRSKADSRLESIIQFRISCLFNKKIRKPTDCLFYTQTHTHTHTHSSVFKIRNFLLPFSFCHSRKEQLKEKWKEKKDEKWRLDWRELWKGFFSLLSLISPWKKVKTKASFIKFKFNQEKKGIYFARVCIIWPLEFHKEP